MTQVAAMLGTVSELRRRLGIESNHRDAQVSAALRGASSMIAAFCGRSFEYSAAVVEYVFGHGTTDLIVARAPISSIAEVLLEGAPVDAASYSSVGFDATAGIIRSQDGFVWTSILAAPGIAGDPLPGHEERQFRVTYAAGFRTPNQAPVQLTSDPDTFVPDLPWEIEEACYQAAMLLFEAPAEKAKSVKLGDSGLPVAVEGMLGPYRFISQA